MANECILCPEQYFLIWRVSFLSLFSSIYAIYNNHYDLAIVPGGVFCTSIMYWYKPDYSWRRTIDMNYVKMALCYQIIRAYNSTYSRYYYYSLIISILFYPIGIYFYKKKLFWNSTYAHCLLHIFANIGNFILYSGKIEPITIYISYFTCSKI
jgi:hypothetical protein